SSLRNPFLWAVILSAQPLHPDPPSSALAAQETSEPTISASTTHDQPGHDAVATEHATNQNAGINTIVINPERLQAIGVKFEPAARRSLNKTIRTVGRVELDEQRLARVNIKIEGWIDDLYVNTTGQQVKRGQVLFALYSPELVATQEEYLLALRGVRTLSKSEFPEVVQGARSTLEMSRRRLLLWDIEDYHIRDLERTGKVLRTLPIHAPLAGTVINKVAVAGMHVNAGDELYTIADLTRIWVVADIYEYELPLVKLGQTAAVSLSYAPQHVFQGRIGFVYPTIDPQTRTAKVRFELDNQGEILKPGMYANVELTIPLGTRLVVPKDAILESGERQILFIHHGRGKLEWRDAKLGLRSGDWVEVLDGLAEGEHIVTSANFLIDSESQLKAVIGGMKGMKH
ncbi:MAG: efflux RND transporter periplasmic adaptor subunit, partial [Gammaproteobacteria bacterium]